MILIEYGNDDNLTVSNYAKFYKLLLFLIFMMHKEDCLFCKIALKEIPVKIIYESDNFIAFPDANPKVDGHLLIISKNHYVNIMDMPATLGQELVDTIKKVAGIMLKQGAEGFNVIQNNFPAAGQIVMHAHIHLLPRKKGDGFKSM